MVLFYQKANKKLDEIFVSQTNKKATVYLPQFCVAETFNTFARLYYKDKSISEELYNSLTELFKEHIKDRKLLYCYDLHRYHNLNADAVIRAEHTVPYNGDISLSTLDILIIAMGIELMHIHPPKNVYVVTGDKRLHKICNSSNSFPTSMLVRDRRGKTKK